MYSTGAADQILVLVKQDKKQTKSMYFVDTRAILFGDWTLHELNTVSEVFQYHGVYLQPLPPPRSGGGESDGKKVEEKQ